MKIVFVSIWYSDKMGYIENCLPQSLARLGHDVHVVTSQAQVYFNHPFYEKAYQKYLGDPLQPVGKTRIEGVTIHRLPFYQWKSKILLRGLISTIFDIKPDVVTIFEHVSIDTFKLVLAKFALNFKLFTANHAVMSVYPTAKNWAILPFYKKALWAITAYLPGRLLSFFIEKCFAVTIDAGEIAHAYRGVQKHKVKVTTLGVDTALFMPNPRQKQAMRQHYGFDEDDIICIYTGKLIAQKQPVLIAQALDVLVKEGFKVKGFFVAEGILADEIRSYKCCQIIPLQPFKELPRFFQMADIAIWAGEESSSQLDAVASGACLMLTDNIKAYDIIDENSSFEDDDKDGIYRPKIVSRAFKHGDLTDLIAELKTLFDKNTREKCAQMGVKEIQEKYSWDIIALNRLEDYNI